MNLRYINAELKDIDRALNFLHKSSAHSAREVAYAQKIWPILLVSGAIGIQILEDLDRPKSSRILTVVATVFVESKFFSGLLGSKANLSRDLFEQFSRCPNSVLNGKSIAVSNGLGDLNLLVLHYCECFSGLSESEVLVARDMSNRMFFAAHRGYNIQETLFELHYPDLFNLMLQGGWHLRKYDGTIGIPSGHQVNIGSALFGITRSEAMHELGSSISSLFAYTPPRLNFSRRHQEFLSGCLDGQTDEALADSLSMSVWTVKKNWCELYSHIDHHGAHIFRQSDEISGSSRGPEKKRLLLAYLRAHPEELRPYTAPICLSMAS